MTAEAARVGGPVAAIGLALLLVAYRRDLRIAGLVAWALGAATLALYLAPHGHAPLLAAAAVVGLALAAVGAAVLRRWPWVLPFAALVCVPARIPVRVGSTDANLLVPLYGVVAAAALALGYDLVRGDRRARELGPLALPLAAFAGWTGLSLAWSQDLRQGAIELLFFFLPFGLLAVALARLPWRREWAARLWALLVAMAVLFAAIGVWQYATRDVFWNPKVIVANAYAPFFRVNSVFWDPSVYGRFLVVAILATLVLVLGGLSRRLAFAAAAAIVAIWLGLLFSFSQSSFAALVVGVLLAASLTWRWRTALLVAAAVAVMAVAAVAVPGLTHHSLNRTSSGRSKLVTGGLAIAAHHPVTGVGVGAFVHAYARREHIRGNHPKSAASHTTPVTVAAETGTTGLLLFAWLLAASLALAFRRTRETAGGRAAVVFGVTLAAIAVHSLFYNAFFEDPVVWGSLGLLPLAVAARELVSAPARPAAAPPRAAVAAQPADRTRAGAG